MRARLHTLLGPVAMVAHNMLLSSSLFQDQILKKCMIILRQEVVEERGEGVCVWMQ